MAAQRALHLPQGSFSNPFSQLSHSLVWWSWPELSGPASRRVCMAPWSYPESLPMCSGESDLHTCSAALPRAVSWLILNLITKVQPVHPAVSGFHSTPSLSHFLAKNGAKRASFLGPDFSHDTRPPPPSPLIMIKQFILLLIALFPEPPFRLHENPVYNTAPSPSLRNHACPLRPTCPKVSSSG